VTDPAIHEYIVVSHSFRAKRGMNGGTVLYFAFGTKQYCTDGKARFLIKPVSHCFCAFSRCAKYFILDRN
jgi:hypothetical protein